ncbi:MAG: D-hexose-6-phosphate mutarotase [Verrucomicrobiota bacterium]
MTLEALAAAITGTRSISLDDHLPDFPILRIANAQAEAAIALHGAHLLDFRPVAAQPLLYLSPTTRTEEGQPVRGGVPLCWPWFGPHPTEPAWPAHGCARDRFWRLIGVNEPSDGVTELAFSLPPESVPEAYRPGPFELTYSVTVGRALDLSLSTTNRGEQPFVIGGALHSYFAVSGLEAVTVEGLEGLTYRDAVLGEEGRQEGPVRFDRHINRVYRAARPLAAIVDSGWQRRIQVDAKGSRTTVVWNAWSTQAADFRDMPNEGYKHFVCVETANADDDLITLGPGESHELACRITAAGLAPQT